MQKNEISELFISYSWDTENHKKEILEFADKLRSDDGIDCILDAYIEGTPEEGWPRWMERQIEHAKYIIIICTEQYLLRWKGEVAKGIGKGVKFESLLTSNMLANDDSLNTKIIPVIVKNEDDKFIPLPLKGASFYSIENKDDYDSLVRYITGQPLVKKPNLGDRRNLPPVNILEKNISAQKYKEIEKKLKIIFDKSLQSFSGLPALWIEPIVHTRDENSHLKTDEDTKVSIQDILNKNDSLIINSRQQYGLTSLAHHLVYEFWREEKPSFWLYLDANELRPYTKEIEKITKKKLEEYDILFEDIGGVILDEFSSETKEASKILEAVNQCFEDKELIIMYTFVENPILDEEIEIPKSRIFEKLYLWSLSRSNIRDVVSQYNNEKFIGDEDDVINKVAMDLEVLNIPRTPLNCLTLLKVSEFSFDDSPVNRTDMLEKVLFLLFNVDEIPQYKTRPDLKDTQFVLGYLSELLLRNSKYTFTRDYFLKTLNEICLKQKIDLEVEVVLDVLTINNIIIYRYGEFTFKFSYWVFYFAAHRMHQDSDFANYIFDDLNYISYPELIEFYAGIDRRRDNAVEILLNDLQSIREVVEKKCGFIKDFNVYDNAKWNPNAKELEYLQAEVSDSVKESKLPDSIKDEYTDRHYDKTKPLDQTIHKIMEEYSLLKLLKSIKASSRTLRNSDYANAEKRNQLLNEILLGWKQVTRVILVLAPVLARNREVSLEGATFSLSESEFKGSEEEIFYSIIEQIPTNIMGWYKDDIFSNKMAPLLYDFFENTNNSLTRHYLALLIANKRPRGWNQVLEKYIKDEGKNSFYLYDFFQYMRIEYKYSFASEGNVKIMKKLLKMIMAKHDLGIKEPSSKVINKVSDDILPERVED